MDLQLAGKTAYVSGTATGIGADIVRVLVGEGVRVFAVDYEIDALNGYVGSESLDAVTTHFADLGTLAGVNDAVDGAVAHFGKAPDIVVNNVGIGRMLPFEELDDDDFHRTFEVNFHSVVRTCRRLIPQMLDAGGGAIVNVTSDLASQPETVFVDYQATKAAIVNFSKSMSRAYAPTIRVNDVSPGPIWTPLWSRKGGFAETMEKNYGLKGQAAIDELIRDREIPMARMGEPAEVARAVAFLASPAASFTTGSNLGVNGGTVRSAF